MEWFESYKVIYLLSYYLGVNRVRAVCTENRTIKIFA